MNAYRLSTLAAACLITLCAGTSRAQDAKSDAAILPFVDEGTFLVARLDIDRVDVEALGKYMEASFDTMVKSFGIPADQQARVRQNMSESVGTAKAWLTDMNAAGARRFYMLLDTADLLAADSAGPTMIVPLAEGADEQRITDIISRDNNPRMQSANIGNAVVFGGASAIERLKKRLEPGAAAVARPELPVAMNAAGDAPLRIALVPTDAARELMEQNLPNLPAPLGGGETSIVSRGVRYATVAVTQKPATQAKIMLRAKDADAAAALEEVIGKGKAFAKSDAEGIADADELKKHLDAIAPKRENDLVTLSVDPMLMMSGVRMSARRQDVPPPAGGQPAKPDDGGL